MSNYKIEKEYKMMLRKDDFNNLINTLKFDKIIKQNNHYYSAPSNKGMRIREIDNHFYFTLKHLINNEVREYEWEIMKNDINDPSIIDLASELKIDKPSYLGNLYTIRYEIDYPLGTLCLDENHYFNTIDYELEYELKDACIDDFKSLEDLLSKYNLTFITNKITKYKRFKDKREAIMNKIAILCANGLEECEALVTVDLLRRAKLDIDIISVEDSLDIISSHNINFKAEKLLKDISLFDYGTIILPGGLNGTKALASNQLIIDTLRTFKEENRLICAICAAPSILIENGLVKNREFSVYPGFEKGHITSSTKVTVTNNIITGQGLGVVFDFAYEIIKYLKGQELAQDILKEIQY